MLKKLRRKFVAIMMSIVILILLIVFLVLLLSTQSDMKRTSEQMLNEALQTKPMAPEKNKEGEGGRPRELRSPTIRVNILANGEIQIESNQFQQVEDEVVIQAAQIAAKSEQQSGTIGAYQLRYLKHTKGQTIEIAFTDTSMETRVIRNLVVNSLIIGAVALLAFLVLSIFLARWAVKPVEEAWQKQKQFVADASHELKTPLTVILSNAEMLAAQSAVMDEKAVMRIDNISAESMRMKYLVEDMLLLAKSDVVQTQKIFAEVCVSDVMMDSVLLYESDIYDEGKKLTYDIEGDIYMLADAQKLRQLIDIFLDNAKKHGRENGQIAVRLAYSQATKQAELSVCSEGNLIPPGELTHIFERFYRVDKARVQNGGFGLGLSIAQSIVAEHKGKIWAESIKDIGNIFYVVLSGAYKKA